MPEPWAIGGDWDDSTRAERGGKERDLCPVVFSRFSLFGDEDNVCVLGYVAYCFDKDAKLRDEDKRCAEGRRHTMQRRLGEQRGWDAAALHCRLKQDEESRGQLNR